MTFAGKPVWEAGGWTPLPPLTGDAATDVCVIGLGGSGLSCIHELCDVGVRVIGIDAGAVGAAAAGRNGGFLLAGTYRFYHDAVAAHGRDRTRAIYQLTLEQIDHIAEETPDAVRRTGSLRIAASPDEEVDCAVQLDAMRDDGLAVEPYDGPEGRGLLLPQDAAFDPLLRARTLATRAVERGALLYEHTVAIDVERGRVATDAGTITCDAVVVAVDGGLVRILPELSSRVRAARLQMLATAPAPEVHLPRPVYSRYGMEYWQQLPDKRVALGGFRDRAGAAAWTDSTEPTSLVQDLLEAHLRDVVGVRAAVTHRWAATVGFTESGLPVCEEVRPDVWALGGYCGTGNVIGAVCGRGVARLVARGDGSIVGPLLSRGERATRGPGTRFSQ